MRVELGNGHFADLKEVDELTSGDQDAVLAAMELRQDPDSKQIIYPGDMSNRMRKACLRRVITGWNLQHPLPKGRPESLDKLTLGQQKALFAAVDEHMKVLNEDPENPEAEGTDPTAGSDSSSAGSPE